MCRESDCLVLVRPALEALLAGTRVVSGFSAFGDDNTEVIKKQLQQSLCPSQNDVAFDVLRHEVDSILANFQQFRLVASRLLPCRHARR